MEKSGERVAVSERVEKQERNSEREVRFESVKQVWIRISELNVDSSGEMLRIVFGALLEC